MNTITYVPLKNSHVPVKAGTDHSISNTPLSNLSGALKNKMAMKISRELDTVCAYLEIDYRHLECQMDTTIKFGTPFSKGIFVINYLCDNDVTVAQYNYALEKAQIGAYVLDDATIRANIKSTPASTPPPAVVPRRSTSERLMGYDYLISQATSAVARDKIALVNMIDNLEVELRKYPLLNKVELLTQATEQKSLSKHLETHPWLARPIHLSFFLTNERVTLLKPVAIDSFAEEALQDIYNHAAMAGLLGSVDESSLLAALNQGSALRSRCAQLVESSFCDLITLMQNPGFILQWVNQPGRGENRQRLLNCLYDNEAMIPEKTLTPTNFFVRNTNHLILLYTEMLAPKNTWTIPNADEAWLEELTDSLKLKSEHAAALVKFIQENEYEKEYLHTITGDDLTQAGITPKGIQAKILTKLADYK